MPKMVLTVADSAMNIFQPEKARRGIGLNARVRYLAGTFPLQIKPSTRGGLPQTKEMDAHGGFKAVECFVLDVTKLTPFDGLEGIQPGTYAVKDGEKSKKDWYLLEPKEDGPFKFELVA